MSQTSELSAIQKLNLFHERELMEEISKNCQLKVFDKKEVVVREGQYITTVPIVVTGSLRVFQAKEDREILLYYVHPKQTCMMSLSACFYDGRSPSQAVVAEKSEILLVPAKFVTRWQRQYASWNDYVIRTFRNRYDELLTIFESVAFDKIDSRILHYLRKNQKNNVINVSHLQLANELGTTRVVVSRILKQFEIDQKIEIKRGHIILR